MSLQKIEKIAQKSLGNLAVQVPGATSIFRRLKFDFCCNGQQTLEQACTNKGIRVDEVLKEIRALQNQEPMPATPTASELIDHILRRYHEIHRQQLSELIRMARRVEAVHRDHPLVPKGLTTHLEAIQEELLEHMDKEENVLFPMFKSSDHPMVVVQPIGMMRHEHVNQGAQVEQLAILTSQHQTPSNACNTWQALYAGTARFTEDLIEHIHLENNLLFPPFEALSTV